MPTCSVLYYYMERSDPMVFAILQRRRAALLTMLAQPGSGTLAGNAHTETFQQIARVDAATLSEVLQRDVDLPLLTAAFPGWPVLAYFEFAPEVSEQASRVVKDAAVLAAAGYAMEPGEVAEKTGYGISGQ